MASYKGLRPLIGSWAGGTLTEAAPGLTTHAARGAPPPRRPTVAIMMDGQTAACAALVADLLVDRCEGIMLDASPAGVRTMGRLAQAGMVDAVIDLAAAQDLVRGQNDRQQIDHAGISAHHGHALPYVAMLGMSGAGAMTALIPAVIRRLAMRKGPVALVVDRVMARDLPPGGACRVLSMPDGGGKAAWADAGVRACLAGLDRGRAFAR